MDWQHLESIATKEQFGTVYLTLKVHEGHVTRADLQGVMRSKKYWDKDNIEAGKDILGFIRDAQDTKTTGAVTFTVNFRNGLIDQTLINETNQLKADVPSKPKDK